MSEERTALLKIDPHDNSAYMALVSEVQSFVSSAEGASIATVELREFATNDLSLIARLKKSIGDLRMDYLAPLKEHTETINAAFKDITDPLAKADSILRQKVLAFNQEQDRIRREAEDLARQEREVAERRAKLNGDVTTPFVPESLPVVAEQRAITDVGESNTMKISKWEVVNFSLIPDEFKMIDAGKVHKQVKAGREDIPGIRIWKEKTLRVEAVKG